MALEPNPRTQRIVDALLESFTPIYTSWREDQSDSKLPKTAEECLYQDVFKLSIALAAMDNRAQFLETRLIAEILAIFIVKSKSTPYEFLVDAADKEIASANKESSSQPTAELDVPDMLMARVINEWVANHETRKTKASSAVEKLLNVVNCLIIADGNITNQEIAVFPSISKKFLI